MTNNQEKHLESIKFSFINEVDAKYRLGAKSHGGDLLVNSPLGILNMMIEEAIDMYVYAVTLREMLLADQVALVPKP